MGTQHGNRHGQRQRTGAGVARRARKTAPFHGQSPSSVSPVPASLPHSLSLLCPLPPGFDPSPHPASSLSPVPPPALEGALYPRLTCAQPSLGLPSSPGTLQPGVRVLNLHIPSPSLASGSPSWCPPFSSHTRTAGGWTNQLSFLSPAPWGLCTRPLPLLHSGFPCPHPPVNA